MNFVAAFGLLLADAASSQRGLKYIPSRPILRSGQRRAPYAWPPKGQVPWNETLRQKDVGRGSERLAPSPFSLKLHPRHEAPAALPTVPRQRSITPNSL